MLDGAEVAVFLATEKRKRLFGCGKGWRIQRLKYFVKSYQIAELRTETSENSPYKGRKIPKNPRFTRYLRLYKSLYSNLLCRFDPLR